MEEKLILEYIKIHQKELGINLEDIVGIKKINTGKRNHCYTIETKKGKLFCKVFNRKLRFASQFDRTRYFVEMSALNWLKCNGCSVPNIRYADEKNEIAFLNYIEGKTLRQTIREKPEEEVLLVRRVLEEISKIHALEVKDSDFPEIQFKNIGADDYMSTMVKDLKLVYTFLGCGNEQLDEKDYENLQRIAQKLSSQDVKYGHFELHSDNIMVDEESIYFIDFEKFHPHIPQLDIISLTMNGNMNKHYINEYVQYYMKLNKITDEREFLYTLDCARIFYNLKIMSMIVRNLLGYETRWREENGKRVKDIRKLGTNFGIAWNSERNESLEMRVRNICNFNFSKYKEIEEVQDSLFSKVLNKCMSEEKGER